MMGEFTPYGRHHVDEDDIRQVVECLRGPLLTQGGIVTAFERAVAAYVGARFAVAVANGTAALHIACLAAGLRPGVSAITSPITFVATGNAILYAGAKPLFADIEDESVNLSTAATREVLRSNPDVRAILPVHFAGLPCDVAALKQVADKAGAVIIEDAAHALGARYSDGQRVGNCAHSLMTMFSFHPVKNITTGEGGIITTNDQAIYRDLRRLRSHGINKDDDPYQCPEAAKTLDEPNPWYYEMQQLGFNYRITDIQCSLGLSQLDKLDGFLARRRQLACQYDHLLEGVRGLRPAQRAGRDFSGHHLYVVRIDFERQRITRAGFMRKLRERQIGSQVHYIPVPAHPFYQRLGYRLADYPHAQNYYREALSIPLYFDLSDERQTRVASTIRELLS